MTLYSLANTKPRNLSVERTKNVVTIQWELADDYEAMMFYDKLTESLAIEECTIIKMIRSAPSKEPLRDST